MSSLTRFVTMGALGAAFLAIGAGQQGPPPTPSQAMTRQFAGVHGKILTMVKEFPEDKINFRPTKDVRTFKEVVVHTLSGVVFGAKAVTDPSANWDELDAKNFKTKAELVAAFEKAIADGNAAIKGTTEATWAKTLFPWPMVIEHSAEGYGELVVYYRLNGLVPPASRPKP